MGQSRADLVYIQVRPYTADRAACYYHHFLLHGWNPEVEAEAKVEKLVGRSYVHFDMKHGNVNLE